ncbi:FAD-dependent oxidoreductase [Pandoraea sp. NPDC087047]|uniref:FAD-dependent oxidoreductase n=1 Tax=Pandoraea sp. NPDC087047 TaxID=3364390 RepID=UPI00381E9033
MTSSSVLAGGVPCSRTSTASRAVVIGAGMAGLLTAHVLTGHFEEVCLVERDDLADAPAARPGVPQGHYVHQLLMRGLRTLEALFPGLERTLLDAGAAPLDWYRSVRWFGAAGWMPAAGEGFVTCSTSRNLLEFAVRQRVQAERRIIVLTGCEVTGLNVDPLRARVCGVTIRPRAGASWEHAGNATTLQADFVVDASGRNSHAPTWLGDAGFDTPRETVVDARVGYASRLYDIPRRTLWRDWQALVVHGRAPECLRSGTIFPIEGNRWIVTLTGAGGDFPCGDEDGFAAFARSLRVPALYDAIAVADPVSPIRQFRRTENRWRHFEEMGRWPAGFAVIGDAACSFNPVYGQGMTIAALSAVVLDAHLYVLRRSGDAPGSLALQRVLARVARRAWIFATGTDLRQIGNAGAEHWRARFMQRYVESVLGLAVDDAAIYRRFLRVMHMVEPPTALFAPSITARVAWRFFRHHAARFLTAGNVFSQRGRHWNGFGKTGRK